MKGLRLGYTKDRSFSNVLRYDVTRNGKKQPGEMHAVLVAPTRSGKGTDVLVPALLEWEGSAVVIDIKGQLCSLTAPERARMGQRVIILNPFKIWPEYIGPDAKQFAKIRDRCVFDARFNPMATLEPESESFGSDCDSLADAIVWQEAGTDASHFTDSARQLVSGVVMQIAATMRPDKKTLNQMREAICDNDKLFMLADAALQGNDDFTRDKLSRFVEKNAKDNREIASVVSTAVTQSGFIGSRAIASNLSASDFRFRDLRRQPTTVYIILPTRHLSNSGKWFRLLIASALNDLLVEEEKGTPCLCVLDEFAQLGNLKLIEDAMGLAAGYGVQMLCVLQDLNQLKKNYKENYETFIANAGVSMWFAPRDVTTSDYISNLCGKQDQLRVNTSTSERPLQPGAADLSFSKSQGYDLRNIMEAKQVRQLGSDEFLMFTENFPGEFYRGCRRPYWLMPEFAGKVGIDPYHTR